MKRITYVIVATMIISIFQTSFFYGILGASFNPSLVLAFTFSLLLMDEDELSMISAFVGGLFMDMLTFWVIGTYTLSFTMILYGLYLFRKYIFKNFTIQMVLIYFAFIIEKIFQNYLSQRVLSSDLILFTASALFGTLATLVFYFINSYIKERFMKSDYRLR